MSDSQQAEPQPGISEGDTTEGVFRFKSSIPPEVLPTIRRFFVAESWLVPPWCQLVVVHWISEGHQTASLETRIEYEYRWACISVFPGWLDSTDEIRREHVLHEFLHFSLNILWNYAQEIVETLIKEDAPKFYQTVETEMRCRMESATQDLAFLIGRKVPAQGKAQSHARKKVS